MTAALADRPAFLTTHIISYLNYYIHTLLALPLIIYIHSVFVELAIFYGVATGLRQVPELEHIFIPFLSPNQQCNQEKLLSSFAFF